MQNTAISLVSLDFDTLKSSLKTYLKTQDKFKDYDFDGSNMSVLLDILSYNTYKNVFYLNMIAAESFLDSAQLRDSVVSRAKELNYTPRSRKSAIAELNLQFAQTGLSTFTIPKGTRFSGQNSNSTYTFVTDSATVLYPSGGFFSVNNFPVYEGRYLSETFIFDYSVEKQRFLLSNEQIDSDSITVNVSEDSGVTYTEYVATNSLFDLTSSSTVYFTQAAENNKYELVFGDGILGKKPKDSAIVVVQYRVTNGAEGNGSTNFTLDDNLGTINGLGSAITPTITVAAISYDGAERESIESIRYNAPRHYETQERAVTANDYRNLVLNQFTRIKTVNVYGGENIKDDVKYGKVFVVPITYSGTTVSESERTKIEKYLNDRSTIGISCTVLQPEYLYLVINTTVSYNTRITTLSAADVNAIVKNAIISYNQTDLNDFNIEFEYSSFTKMIDNSDNSITSNETTLQLKKLYQPELNVSNYISVNFDNSVIPGTFISSDFSSNGRTYAYTDYNPNLNTFSIVQEKNKTVIQNNVNTVYLVDKTIIGKQTYSSAGIIDYNNGIIDLNSIVVNSYLAGQGIEFYATPKNPNVYSKNNNLLSIDVIDGINIEIRAE